MPFLPGWAWQNWNKLNCIDFHGLPSSEKDETAFLPNSYLHVFWQANEAYSFFSPIHQIFCFCSCATTVWTGVVTALPSLTTVTYAKNAELNRLGLNVLEIWRGEWSLAVHQKALKHSEADSSCALCLIQRRFSSRRIKLFTVWFPSCRSRELLGSVHDTKSHKQVQGVYEFLWRWQQTLLLFQMCNAVGPERHNS